MFTKTLIAAFVALSAATLASPAFALEGDTGQSMTFNSTLNRAEVRAAFIEARNAGLITVGEHTVAVENLKPTGMALTRAGVRAAFIEARNAGLITAGEHTVAVENLKPTGMALTRAQVLAELREAHRIGAIEYGDKPYILTERQLSLIRMAGERAVAMAVAAR